ncbi:PREDICTED: DNA excision repair protein ERCC-6-like 2 isoform X2 [Amphimedon queenslandica]|uniref:Uncharacterized protein n=1 Tax=Amphimedon queenslandica TaxID=400682 RepID=A0AAN0J791_AMPQE|nr:PREDICTED: DNA excision repair protein ERCC-6-like 2 isoform X2 [Amphimedon queenslandica]|eukprot:XP_019852622.1 PREDICTED: DNA excision repair protein ERCC-6-like 2 isoform X2 [Amphimedon queenslandica]
MSTCNLDRPQFAHSSISLRKPYVLSTPEIVPSICVPAPINQYLREYQRDGIKFLYSQYSKGVGGLLCDDMGLGKTVQVIAFICAILCKTCTKIDVFLTGPKLVVSKSAVLVICPCSVIYNWVSEIETWSHLKTGVYHRNKKDEILDKVSRGRLDVVLTTLETAKLKVEELNSIPWLAVFVDEVHALKNPKSQVTEALLQLKCQIRFGLTGTALQNRLSELWCILNWIHPGCLGAWHEFQFIYERPLLQGQKFDCTRRELATAKEKQQQLSQLLSDWMIRRTKELIADQLPKKEEFVVFCPVTKLQGNIYSTILETDEMVNFVEAHQPCWCNSGLSKLNCCDKHCSSGLLSVQGIYLSLLLKCSNHIGLLLPSFFASDKQNEKAYQICKQVFSHYPEFLEMSIDASFLTLADPTYCGKMQILSKLLSHFHLESSKVIIFSESVRLLNILENYMVCRSYTYCRLDGSMRVEDRGAVVSKFNSDPSLFVFLISKKCGGVGLNITGANRVIIFDPSWNPANDLQAEDRAFRIGQRQNVEVYRLISEGTIEEILYLRQIYKQQLANTAIEGSNERRYFTGVDGDSDNKGEIFGVLNLFQPLRSGASLTENVLKRFDQGMKMRC